MGYKALGRDIWVNETHLQTNTKCSPGGNSKWPGSQTEEKRHEDWGEQEVPRAFVSRPLPVY